MLQTKRLKNWRARRAGGKMTVYGEHADTGQPDKVTQIDTIVPGKPQSNCCIAKRADGSAHHLLMR